jgi:hypothetical protein
MAPIEPSELTTIRVHQVSGQEAAEATDLVEHLIEKYTLTPLDTDALFNAMVAIFIRARMIYGDRQPSSCSLSDVLGREPGSEKN